MNWKHHLEFARGFIAESRALILDLWECADLEVEMKQDSSIVTKLDRQTEVNFRLAVEKQFPRHSVLGEEFGLAGTDTEYTWVIDPIDGTQSLVNGVPTFGTFLALLHQGEPVLGVIDIPALNRGVSGAVGLGVIDERGRKITFPAHRPFSSNDIIAIGTPGAFAEHGEQSVEAKLHNAFPACRIYYDCFGSYLVAISGIAALVEMNASIWDVVATEALVRAAGGTVRIIRQNQDLLGLRSVVCGRKEVVEEIERVLANT